MKIQLKEITIKDVVAKYADNEEEGVVGYNGKLNIRPKYQREFVYDEKKRNAVIDTIRKKFPLNVMYWVKNEDGTFEVLDGQQRTISFCQYINGDFSLMLDGREKAFHNLTEVEKKQILDYKLMIYWCEGNDKEKLDWFKIINIAGEKLTEQELRNAVYTGQWLTHAKAIFSKTNCAAYRMAKDYISGSPIRQDYLEIALNWISGGKIEAYMSKHHTKSQNANELWTYFQNVINWVELTFTTKRSIMRGLDWGWLYDNFGKKTFDTKKTEEEIKTLLIDDEVQNKKGVYFYILTRDEKYLNLRQFSDGQKLAMFEKQGGMCPKCKKQFELKQMHGDHIDPWSKGGKTELKNGQMLCAECNRRKSSM